MRSGPIAAAIQKTINRNYAYLLALVVLTIIGFWLRYRCLGCLGFRGDEDLTSLAVKALSEKGVSELPSGMIYLRFFPYQALLAQSTEWLGFSEYSMRLPSVFVGTLLIPAGYYFASKLTNRTIGLLVAFGIALSFTQVEVARAARMYAPFYLIYAITVYTIYRAHYANAEKLWSPLALLLCLATLTIHQLGYSLAILFVMAIPVNPTLQRSITLVAQAAAVAVAFFGIKQYQEQNFYRAIDLASAHNTSEPVAGGGGLIAAILDQVALPDLSLLTQLVGASSLLTVFYAAAVIAAFVLYWRASGALGALERAAGFLALLFAATHQFNLTLIALGLMIVAGQKGLTTMRDRPWLVATSLSGGLFALWLLLIGAVSALGVGQFDITEIGFRKLARLLVDYPNFRLFWSFVTERPLLALPLALGTLWAIDACARKRPKPEALFLIAVFWAVLFANGALKTKFEVFRYNLHVDIFFLTLCAIGVLRLPEILDALGLHNVFSGSRQPGNKMLVGITLLLTVVSVRPDMALLTSSRGYYEEGPYYEFTGLNRYTDFSSAAAFVAERRDEDDLILVFDPREYWNYIGHVDYWIYSDNYQSQTHLVSGVYRDLYVDVPLLHTKNDVETVIDNMQAGDAWFVYTRSRLDRSPWISAEIKAYIRTLDDQVVYTGRDRDTVVIRLTAGDDDTGL